MSKTEPRISKKLHDQLRENYLLIDCTSFICFDCRSRTHHVHRVCALEVLQTRSRKNLSTLTHLVPISNLLPIEQLIIKNGMLPN